MVVQGLFFLDWLKQLFSAEGDQPGNETVQTNKQICVTVSEEPWARPYDIEGDGYIDSVDLAARLYIDATDSEAEIFARARVASSFDKDCLAVQLGMLDLEVTYKLRTVVARLPQGELSLEQTDTVLEQIDAIEREALTSHARLSENSPFSEINRTVYARIIEMCLRARGLVQGVGQEPFGVGVDLIPFGGRSNVTGWEVTDIHPESAALRDGLYVGDVIVAIGGRTISALSTDGTPEGFTDPNTQMLRGMGGERGSVVQLRVARDREIIELSVRRNIWSARALTVPQEAPVWDGSMMHQEESKATK